MERAGGGGGGWKTLNAITSTPLHLRSRARFFPPLNHNNLRSKLSLSITSPSPRYHLCNILSTSQPVGLFTLLFGWNLVRGKCRVAVGEAVKGKSLPRGAGEGIMEDARNKLLQVVLVSPQIPGNTGCIARTCAASAVGLHLVGPLGFKVDDAKLKRAGLDYWPYVVVKIHSSWAEFQEYFRQQEGERRLIAFSKRGMKIHSEFCYRRGDYLVFGSETSGLPPEALSDCKREVCGGGTLRIPMVETYVRCLNLSVSVGIALYEAARQLNYEQLESAPETCGDGDELLAQEDIFA